MMIAGPLLLLLSIALLGVGLALMYRGWRGTPDLTAPKCAKCGYDLRGVAGGPPAVCSECGADLTKPGGVRWGDYRRRPGMMWAGAAVLVVPLGVWAAMAFSATTGTRPGRPASNAALIANLPRTWDQPWDWQELERRYNSGSLTNAEASKAVDQLIAALNARGGSGAAQGPLAWAQRFVEKALSSGAVSSEQHLRLAQAYYGATPVVEHSTRVAAGETLAFRVKYGGPWNLPGAEFVKALRTVKLPDGREAAVVSERERHARTNQPPNPDLLSATGVWDVEGRVKVDLPPGEHTLTFSVDAATLPQGSMPRVVEDKPGQVRHWPSGPARWAVDVPVKVTVVQKGGAVVERVTDAPLDPRAGIKVKSARVVRQGAGQRLVVELDVGRPKTPLSFDVVLRVAGKEHPAGMHVVSGTRTTYAEHAVDFPALPAEVTAVDVVLRPNAAHAQALAGIDRIWGGEIELKDVPVRRYDLEATEPQKQ